MANEPKLVITLLTSLEYGYTCRICGRTEPGPKAVKIEKESGEEEGLICCSHSLQEVIEFPQANVDPFAWVCSVCGQTQRGDMLFCTHSKTVQEKVAPQNNPRYAEMTKFWPVRNRRPRKYRDPYW